MHSPDFDEKLVLKTKWNFELKFLLSSNATFILF